MAAVCGPLEPLAAKASVPMVVEFWMLVEPSPHVASDATLWPLSVVMVATHSGAAGASLRIELATEYSLPPSFWMALSAPAFAVSVSSTRAMEESPPTAAPRSAMFAEKVLLVTVPVDQAAIAPPNPLLLPASLPVNVLSLTVSVPVPLQSA